MSNILPSDNNPHLNNNHRAEINNLSENPASNIDPASLIDTSFNTKDAPTPATEMNHELAEFERKLRSITDKLSVNREGFVQLPQDIAQKLVSKTGDMLSKDAKSSNILEKITDFLTIQYPNQTPAEEHFNSSIKELESHGRCIFKEEIIYPQSTEQRNMISPLVALRYRHVRWV